MVIYFSCSWWGKEELFVSPSPTHRIFCSRIAWNVHILCSVFWSYPSTCPYVHHLISLPTLRPPFFSKRKNYTPLSSISAAHMDMGKGPTLKQGELTRGHATKGEWLSFLQISSRASISLSEDGASVALPPPPCVGILIGLILCQSCAGHRNHCELISVAIWSTVWQHTHLT